MKEMKLKEQYILFFIFYCIAKKHTILLAVILLFIYFFIRYRYVSPNKNHTKI